MSVRFTSPILPSAVPTNPNTAYSSPPPAVGLNHASPHIAIGPPPGLGYPQGGPISHSGNNNGAEPQADLSKAEPPLINGERLSFVLGRESQVRVPSAVLSVRKYYQRP